MPRRKPTATNALAARKKLKKAIKRGDVPAPEPKKQPGKGKHALPVSDAIQSARKLQSAFVKLPDAFLEQTKYLAATLPLTRPIAAQSHQFPPMERECIGDTTLSCPRRPKWRFEMSKTEVERNEEGVFRKWISQTDQAIEEWQKLAEIQEPLGEDEIPPEPTTMPRSTTYYERNIEVWRQLWRVTEISQIILVLLDSRAPLLHYPPSLREYLSDRRVILVLTKVDIAGAERADAWTRYLETKFPGVRIVQVESYMEKEMTSVHQGRKQREPKLPESFRHLLVQAIREEHAALLQPPEKVQANPARLASWKPPVKREIDWQRVVSAQDDKAGTFVGGPAVPHDDASEAEPKFLTIGLIGQPNVGKSSLLNALFGTSKVRASKTPGKTKHFQTLFWTPDVRLVDCPGLVCPNYVPMELQVLSGVLPISRISALPSCVYHAAELLPLEQIYRLSHPAEVDVPEEDKRTWRNGERPAASRPKELKWTAMDVLIAYADKKKWVTAKANRPDIHRAGNAIMRSLAEGRVAWAFWPPESDGSASDTPAEMGIWIPREEEGESDEESEEKEAESEEDEAEDALEPAQSPPVSDESDSESDALHVGSGRFGALQDSDDVDSSEPESDASS
ncbi:GTPase [Roridomyces roridus]|uniref:Guanine nucleotide-binding protein-like 1 n=1 Tax=Roridomyces roridus TaxID=1738132 RepID=A0AAD7BUK8_9AGAR|nr:GTPase [Roridomyces roridus]